MVLAVWRLKMREMVEAICISHDFDSERWLLWKLSRSRWVSLLLTFHHKHNRLKYFWKSVEQQPKRVLHRLITVVETWIDNNISKTKQQSKQMIFPGEAVPKKVKVDLSTKSWLQVLESTQYNPHQLPAKEKNNQWQIFYQFIGLVQRFFEEKTIAFG